MSFLRTFVTRTAQHPLDVDLFSTRDISLTMARMARFVTNVPKYRLPPKAADHYFKLSNRLSYFCGIELKLDVSDFDRVDTTLEFAIMAYHAMEKATDRDALTKTLKHFSEQLKIIAEVLNYVGGTEYEAPSLDEDVAFLIRNEMETQTLRECISYLNKTKDSIDSAISKVTGKIIARGRKDLLWYDIFVDGMRFVAMKSDISLNVQARGSVKLNTPFLILVAVYEMCLPREMRSGNRVNRAKRIATSLNRLAKSGVLEASEDFLG